MFQRTIDSCAFQMLITIASYSDVIITLAVNSVLFVTKRSCKRVV